MSNELRTRYAWQFTWQSTKEETQAYIYIYIFEYKASRGRKVRLKAQVRYEAHGNSGVLRSVHAWPTSSSIIRRHGRMRTTVGISTWVSHLSSSFFSPHTAFPTLHHVPSRFFFLSRPGFRSPRLPVGGRTAPPRPFGVQNCRVVMVTALSATPPRQHGRRPTHPFSPTHSTSLPPLPKCRGSARGCSRSGGSGGESTPAEARNPHGGMAYTRSKNPRTGTSATHSRLAVSAIRLRVYVCEICICVSYRPGS